MKKAMILAIIFMACIVPTLAYDSVTDISLRVWKSGEVELRSAEVIYGSASSDGGEGDYRLVVEDVLGRPIWEKRYSLSFIVHASVPRPVPYIIIDEKVPYEMASFRLSLYRNEDGLFTTPLDFCDSNGRCDSSENYVSCPSDCERRKYDGFCINLKDGFCDRDCFEGYDPDCKRQETFVRWSFVVFLVFIIMAVTAAAIEREKIKKIYQNAKTLARKLYNALLKAFENFK